MGFAVLQLGDHLADLTGHVTKPPVSDEADAWGGFERGSFAPLTSLMAAAAATSRLRLCPSVLNNDFRNPAVVAKELATMDMLSDGRLEIGLGCGNYHGDYEVGGLSFDRPALRMARLKEATAIVKQLLENDTVKVSSEHYAIRSMDGPPSVQRPHPPIMIGASGPKMLSFAAHEADIVAILRDPATSFAEQMAIVRAEAGDHFDDVEINVSVRPGLGCGWMGADRSLSLGGSVDEMVSFLQRERDENDVSYISLMDTFGPPDRWAPVVEALAGQ
jgi:alkanesulfonate monooxygenase SsuD/methylene tetrahydromethanopterin reductase-like flavin-dependent oxidoreductase (luciferase family)